MFTGLLQEGEMQKANALAWVRSAFRAAQYEEDAYKRAYLLSMPLLVSAQLGETAQYTLIASWMDQALTAMTPDQKSRKAWLLGRYVQAAILIHSPDVATFAGELRALLEDQDTRIDAYSAWGWGYLAMHGPSYADARTPMMKSAFDNTQLYLIRKQDKKLKLDGKELAEELSSLLWVRVMHLQAAADAGDKDTYRTILRHIPLLAQKSSVADALSTGVPDSDFRLWVLMKAYLAAKKMQDIPLCNTLFPVLKMAMDRAEKEGAAFMLAQCELHAAEHAPFVEQDYVPAFLSSAL